MFSHEELEIIWRSLVSKKYILMERINLYQKTEKPSDIETQIYQKDVNDFKAINILICKADILKTTLNIFEDKRKELFENE